MPNAAGDTGNDVSVAPTVSNSGVVSFFSFASNLIDDSVGSINSPGVYISQPDIGIKNINGLNSTQIGLGGSISAAGTAVVFSGSTDESQASGQSHVRIVFKQ